MNMNVVTLLYLVASVCFIQALKGLSNPASNEGGIVSGITVPECEAAIVLRGVSAFAIHALPTLMLA